MREQFETFQRIARISGSGSQGTGVPYAVSLHWLIGVDSFCSGSVSVSPAGTKVDTIKKMMNSAQGCEARYIVRALQGKMRIGLAEPSVLVAIGHAFALSPPPAVAARAEAVPRNAEERKEFLNSMAAIVKACTHAGVAPHGAGPTGLQCGCAVGLHARARVGGADRKQCCVG